MASSLEALVALFLNLALALAGSDFGWLWLSPSACGSLCLPLALSYICLPLALGACLWLWLASLIYSCCLWSFAALLS